MKKYILLILFMFGLCLFNTNVNALEEDKMITCDYIYTDERGTSELTAVICLSGNSELCENQYTYNPLHDDQLKSWYGCYMNNYVPIQDDFFSEKKEDVSVTTAKEYYEKHKACPPYFYVDSGKSCPGNPNFSDAGYFSDKDNLISNGTLSNPSDYHVYKFVSSSPVEKNEDGEYVPKNKKYSCNLVAVLGENAKFSTTATVNKTSKNILFSSGEFLTEETENKDYIDNFDYSSEKDPCPEGLYVCLDSMLNYQYIFTKDKTGEQVNGDPYKTYRCFPLDKTDTQVQSGLDFCGYYGELFNDYIKFEADKNYVEANKSLEKLKKYCNSALSNLNYSDYEYSCINLCLNLKKDVSSVTGEDYEKPCGISEKVLSFIANIFRWIKYIIPVIVIVMGILDFIKAIGADKEDEMKKAQGRFVKRLIAAALAFIIPFILEFVLDKMGFGYDDCGLF